MMKIVKIYSYPNFLAEMLFHDNANKNSNKHLFLSNILLKTINLYFEFSKIYDTELFVILCPLLVILAGFQQIKLAQITTKY